MFDLLLSTTNPGSKLTRWTHDGVEFERERHSFTGPKHGLTIEIITLTRSGRRGWSLMVTKEYWWAGAESKAFKNLRWARALGGQRSDLFAWLRAQEAALERSSTFPRASAGQDRVDPADRTRGPSEKISRVQNDDQSH
ncbi:MAG: hypothetical protein WBW74_08285 [Xanthobacteraceae bacterium]